MLQMVLGRRLQGYRLAAGLSAEVAAGHISRTVTAVTRMERSEAALDPIKVKPLLDLYGVPDATAREYLELAQEANRPGWWQKFHDVLPAGFGVHVSLETSASQIRSYEPNVVPGLFQTPAYCEAVLRRGFPDEPSSHLARRVELRMERQELLRKKHAPLVWTVIDESVLRRPAGPPEIMLEQIEHLCDQSSLPNVSVQIIPYSAGLYHGAFGPFSIFRFPVGDFPDVVATENLEGTAYKEDDHEVALYRETFENMFSAALSIGDTCTYMHEISEEYKQ